MSTSLVYLHIPKSAGTSHRDYLSKVYGEESIFWYGLHADSREFDAGEVGEVPAIGGHKPLSFYPPTMDALYTSVVRDPVERAVSFYNYCTCAPESSNALWSGKLIEAQQEWRDRGIDPNSLVKSIENCEAFRVEVSNLQCAYLSRYEATLEGVKQSLQETDMVVGIFDQLGRFNEFFQDEIGFPISNRSRTNEGRAGYSSGILEEPGVIGLLRSINLEDQALYDFVRLIHSGLYVGAKNIAEVRRRVPSIEERSHIRRGRAAFSWGDVHLYSKGLVNLRDGDKAVVPLMLKNGTNNHIVLSSDNDCRTAIGWRIESQSGEPVEGLQGVVKTNQTIPARESKGVMVVIDTADLKIPESDLLSIQFGIVHDGEWMWDKMPLNSTWSRLYV